MKNRMFFLIVVAVLLLTMTACQKENTSQETTEKVNIDSIDNNEDDLANNEDEEVAANLDVLICHLRNTI